MPSLEPRLLVFLFAVSLIISAPTQAQTRRVLILTTGGTIASRIDAPMESGESLVDAVPALLDHARVEVEEFSRIGSSQMTPSHWSRKKNLALRLPRVVWRWLPSYWSSPL